MRKHDNPEACVENLLCKMVKERGGLCYKWVSPPDNPGVPDRIVITPEGRVLFVEIKVETGRLQNIQKWQHSRLQECHADVRTVHGVEQVKTFIKEIFQE